MISVRGDADRSGILVRSLGGKADTTKGAAPHEIEFPVAVGLKEVEGFCSWFQRGADELFPTLELVDDRQLHVAAAVIMKGLPDERGRRKGWSGRGSDHSRSGKDHGTKQF